jgi:hypothetical protein
VIQLIEETFSSRWKLESGTTLHRNDTDCTCEALKTLSRNHRERQRPSWKGSTAYYLRTLERLGPGIGGGSDDGHSGVPDVWH